MSDPGYAAFLAVHRRTFRIETRGAGGLATGFFITRLQESNRLILATAGHVINELPVKGNEAVEWEITQLDAQGATERQFQFTTRPTDKERIYVYHQQIDIGFIVLPTVDQTGKTIALPDEKPLPTIDTSRRITEGTRVGWAGFPYQVGAVMGEPRLCYFEGVVSAFYSRVEDPMYIVDGHCAPGVSGGPVWHWPQGGEGIEIIGVVTAYGGFEDAMPGFCMFVPINPLMARLRSDYKIANSS